MENKEYNRLIYNNKLDELANIWNISDLTRYIYLNKYLLEYLLEKGIHNTRMDNFAKNNILWINLYIKYGITKPILNIELDKLLIINGNELLLETILKKLRMRDKLELYHNFKNNSYWILRKNETLLINIYQKYYIDFPRNFIKLPSNFDSNIKVNSKFQLLINEFMKVFNDIDYNVLNVYINEFKRKFHINRERAYIDIKKLIEYKKHNKDFKLAIDEYESDEVSSGEYDSEKQRLTINNYSHNTFSHELSHLFYDELENPKDTLNVIYKTIQDKIVTKESVEAIINYLKEFHARFAYMKNIFRELYYTEIKKNFGNFDNYCQKIYQTIIDNKPEDIVLDKNDTTIYIDYDNLDETVIELISDECEEYVKIMLKNYYSEELMLENLLDAILKGNIFDDMYDVRSLSGHSRKSFRKEKNLSFNECLANFDAIKNSSKSNILINKLRELIGNEMVDYLEEYITKNRMKIKNKKR